MSRQRCRLMEVESMEGKLLLSTMHVHVAVSSQNPTPVLDGTYNSNIRAVRSSGTTNPTITEVFSGSSKSTGRAQGTIIENVDTASNTLTSAGFLIQNSKGSVLLKFTQNDLVSQTTGKTSSNEVLTYTVVSGSGAFANATGNGTFSMTYQFKSGAVQVKLHSN